MCGGAARTSLAQGLAGQEAVRAAATFDAARQSLADAATFSSAAGVGVADDGARPAEGHVVDEARLERSRVLCGARAGVVAEAPVEPRAVGPFEPWFRVFWIMAFAAALNSNDMNVVPSLDLQRYAGK